MSAGPRLTGFELRVLLDLFMVSDPWPLEEGPAEWRAHKPSHMTMLWLVDSESRLRGYEDWVDAYHNHQRGDSQ